MGSAYHVDRAVEATSATSEAQSTEAGLRKTGRTPALAVLLALMPLIVIVGVAAIWDRTLLPLATRDVTVIAQVHPLIGFLSSMGAFLWFGCAAVCLHTVTAIHAPERPERRLLAWAVALSLFLWFDDFFLLHEELAPAAGIPERMVNVAVVTWVALYAWMAWTLLPPRRLKLLALALGLLAASMTTDWLLPFTGLGFGARVALLEDGTKWLGICAWLGFHVGMCRSYLAPDLRRAGLR